MWLLGVVVSAWAGGEPSGQWVLAESPEAVQTRIDAAVDEAASAFGLFRGIARGRIARGATWCTAYAFGHEPAAIGWQCDDKPRFELPREDLGRPFVRDYGTGPIETTVTWSPDAVTARFGGAEGGRSQVFRFAPDGTLTLDVAIESPRLPAPIRWTIAYRRADTAGT